MAGVAPKEYPPPFDPEEGWLVTGQSTIYLHSVEKRQ